MSRPRVFPLLFMFALIAAMIAIAVLSPTWRMVPAPAHWLGAVPLATGVLLIAVSAGMFRRRHTTINPFGESSTLVQDGLYRHSRNPMYLGMLLVLAGTALGLGQLLPFLALPVFMIVVSRHNIRQEEQALAARFGDDYRNYLGKVRRWI